jgi:hypothetical protein
MIQGARRWRTNLTEQSGGLPGLVAGMFERHPAFPCGYIRLSPRTDDPQLNPSRIIGGGNLPVRQGGVKLLSKFRNGVICQRVAYTSRFVRCV